MRSAEASRVALALATAMCTLAPRQAAADLSVTWTSVPTSASDEPSSIHLDARGFWTESGTLYGYDGAVVTKLAAPRHRWIAARASGVFLIASSKGKPTLDAAHLPPDRIARVVDIDRPNDHKGGVVLWYRGGDAIWGLEGPSGAGIADAYDATDGRVCVSFWLSREQTLDVDGTRKTLGRAKMNTAHVGCFSVPIAAKPDAAPGP